MGWWSVDILGGDTPLDFQGTFEDMAGIEPSYSDNPTPESDQKKLIESLTDTFLNGGINDILNRWGCGEEGSPFFNEYKSIGYQVLAVMYMRVGAVIDEELKGYMLYWIPLDEWAKEDDERKSRIDNLIKALEGYDGSSPMVIKSQGLFEVMADHLSGGKNGLINKNI